MHPLFRDETCGPSLARALQLWCERSIEPLCALLDAIVMDDEPRDDVPCLRLLRLWLRHDEYAGEAVPRGSGWWLVEQELARVAMKAGQYAVALTHALAAQRGLADETRPIARHAEWVQCIDLLVAELANNDAVLGAGASC